MRSSKCIWYGINWYVFDRANQLDLLMGRHFENGDSHGPDRSEPEHGMIEYNTILRNLHGVTLLNCLVDL